MKYANTQYHQKESFKFYPILWLAVVWFCVSLFFALRSDPFHNFSFFSVVRASADNIGSANKVHTFTATLGSLNSGSATEILVKKLTDEKFNPIVGKIVTRDQFSAQGTIITMNNDSFEVFEYSDNSALVADILAFHNSSKTRSGAWKKAVNLYQKGNLIIFYMGEKVSIIDALRNY